MNELETTSERIQNLLIDMVMVMEKYKDDSRKIVDNVQKELDKSLIQQRKMMVDMVRDDVLQQASIQVKAYTENMDGVWRQMVEQIREFNTYLHLRRGRVRRRFGAGRRGLVRRPYRRGLHNMARFENDVIFQDGE